MLESDLSVSSLELSGVLTRNARALNATLQNRTKALTCTISKNASLDYYHGAYEFTPSDEEQIIPTKNKFVSGDIVVGAVPSNYGLITWNGSVLTVS